MHFVTWEEKIQNQRKNLWIEGPSSAWGDDRPKHKVLMTLEAMSSGITCNYRNYANKTKKDILYTHTCKGTAIHMWESS